MRVCMCVCVCACVRVCDVHAFSITPRHPGINCPADVMATPVASTIEGASLWMRQYCGKLADSDWAAHSAARGDVAAGAEAGGAGGTTARPPVDFFLLAGNYTLLDLTAWQSGILDLCKERGIGIVVGAPFASGILARTCDSYRAALDPAAPLNPTFRTC